MNKRLTGLPMILPEDPSGGDPAGGGGTPTVPPAGDAKFTQADLDAKITERLNRERAKFADYGDLQAKAARLEEIETANASELEKAVKKAVGEATTAERTRVAGILAAAEARAQAAAKFQNPATAVKLLDLSGVPVSEEGDVDKAAVTALLDSLATSDPYLLKSDKPPVPTPGQAGIGVTGGTPQPTTAHGRLRQSIEADIAAGARH